jgi:hypothetical protein
MSPPVIAQVIDRREHALRQVLPPVEKCLQIVIFVDVPPPGE